MSRAASLLVLAGVTACSGDDRSPSAPPPPPPTALTLDAGVSSAAIDAGTGITSFKPHNPDGAFAFDEMPAPRPVPRAARDRRPIQLLLRSTPPGALAIVDGIRVGPTPVLWEGEVTGEAREFFFVLAGHALGRYKFVPITNGIVHATLAKSTDDPSAAPPELPPMAPPAPRPPAGSARPAPEPRPALDAGDAPDAPDAEVPPDDGGTLDATRLAPASP